MGRKIRFHKKKNQPDAPDVKDSEYRDLLKYHKIPILTLDVRWHELFPEHKKSSSVKALEKRLNQLVKRQGKLVTDNKDMKKLKKKLMHGIVDNMKVAEGLGTEEDRKKQEVSQKMILEINDKMQQADEELLHIPYEIQKANEDLMVESMRQCYQKMKYNAQQIEVLAAEVEELRTELKEKLLSKQDMEMENEKIYTYMHAIFGANVMEILDQMNDAR